MAEYLRGIAARMKRDAIKFPGRTMRPPHIVGKAIGELKHGAILALMFDGGEFKLRITRIGRAPKDDTSERGPERRAGWNQECETLRHSFEVPDKPHFRDDAEGGFYFRIYAWAPSVQEMASAGVEYAPRLL
jgi:hypothetical protein